MRCFVNPSLLLAELDKLKYLRDGDIPAITLTVDEAGQLEVSLVAQAQYWRSHIPTQPGRHEAGSAFVSLRILADLCSSSGSLDLSLSTGDKNSRRLHVVAGDFEAKIPFAGVAPRPGDFTAEHAYTIKAGVLGGILGAVLPSLHEGYMGELATVLSFEDDGAVRALVVEGARMVSARSPQWAPFPSPLPGVVAMHRGTARSVVGMVGDIDPEDNVTVSVNAAASAIRFEAGHRVLTSQTSNIKVPPLQKIIPVPALSVQLTIGDLRQLVRGAGTAVDQTKPGVVIRLGLGDVTAIGQGLEATSKLSVPSTTLAGATPITVKLDHSYMTNAMRSLKDGEIVRVDAVGDNRPVVFSVSTDPAVVVILMPMVLEDAEKTLVAS